MFLALLNSGSTLISRLPTSMVAMCRPLKRSCSRLASPPRSVTKAMRRPSGDQVGCSFDPSPAMMRLCFVATLAMRIWKRPFTREV
jgi:hypothetical protein